MKNTGNQKHSISRRKFLGSSAAIAALSVVPASLACSGNQTAVAQPAAGDAVASDGEAVNPELVVAEQASERRTISLSVMSCQ